MRGRGNPLSVAGLVASLAFGAIAQPAPEQIALRQLPQVETSIRSDKAEKSTLADAARKYMGTPYEWGGRNTKKNPNLDCLGLLFLAIRDNAGVPWRSWSVYPYKLIPQLDRNSTRKTVLFSQDPLLDSSAVSKIKEGDLIFFLADIPSNDDRPMARDSSGKDLYVCHTAVYGGRGNAIHASPFGQDPTGRKVVEEPLLGIARADIIGFIAVEPPRK